ncbi:MAG: PH domain-containing protein [Clostridia bacterium]|nr:PH domain-containing protein [Clostridia bacterium]
MKKQIEERFNELLDKNEEIQKIEKPNTRRFFIIQFLIALFTMFIISACAMIELVEYYGFGVVWAPCAISAFCILIYMLLSYSYYKNSFYCITNKRILIRYGIIGVDYKEIDLKEVSVAKVKRIWYDVWFKSKTGTIILGSLEDKDIELSFDEMGALYRLSGVNNVEEIYELIQKTMKEVMPKDKTNSSDWKMFKKELNPKDKTSDESTEMFVAEADKDKSKTKKSKKRNTK